MSDELIRLNAVTKSMGDQVKNWQTPGREPTMAAIAASIDGWQKTVKNFIVYDSLRSVSLNEAANKLDEAWENRGDQTNKAKSIDFVKQAVDCLNNVPSEVGNDTPYVDTRTRNQMAKLYGSEVTSRSVSTAIQGDVDQVRRAFRSFVKGNVDRYSSNDIAKCEGTIRSMAMRYAGNERISGLFSKMLSDVTKAADSYPDQDSVNSYLDKALRTLGVIENEAQTEQEPEGMLPALTDDDADDLSTLVTGSNDGLINDFEAFEWNKPEELLPIMVEKARQIKATLDQFDAAPEAKLADDMLSGLEECASNSKSIEGVKFGWKSKSIKIPFEIAWNKAIELSEQLG